VFLLLSLLACSSDPPRQVTTSDIPWKDGTLSMALASLEAKCGIQTGSNVPDDYYNTIKKLQADISLVDEQVARLNQTLEEIQGSGVGNAALINFDPRATTLSAKNVQDALDEMMARLKVLEHHVLDEMGEPGPGLFEIPKDKKGSRGSKGGPGGPGGPGGAGGSPDRGPNPGGSPPHGPGHGDPGKK